MIDLKTKVQRGLASLAATVALTTALGVVAEPGMAGDHWLSRANVYMTNGDTMTITPLNGAALAAVPRAALSANATFDLVISLEANPTGDDDANVDAGAIDNAQNAYEARVKEFANALFEATNGKHRIRRVTIYRNYDQRNLADVQWEQDCANDNGPWAHPGGFQKAGKYIHFCTNWGGSSSMAQAKASGYTLAHEWGHYAYNVYDEYAANQCQLTPATLFGLLCPAWQPRSTDTVSDTIMHSQWFAASGAVRAGYGGASSDYLEFSTSDHAPFNSPLGPLAPGRNGQERYFGESAWETLTRNPASDPTYPGLDRTQYTNLTAPMAPTWREVTGTAGAQSELDIRWVSDQVAELLIDRSGSMGGDPLVNAKLGAGVLIAQLPAGDSAIGVASFASAVARNFAITDIPDPDTTVKTDATNAVNGLVANGGTSLYDGLIFALDEIKAINTATGISREAVVYVLSDGGDTVSTATEADVIAAYQAEGVAIVSFGYGLGAPTGTLAAMAAATGGLFLQSPTTAAEITAALLSANAAFSDNSLIVSKSVKATASARTSTRIPVDSTLETMSLAVTYSGNSADVSLILRNPAGQDTGAVFTCSGSASCTGLLNAAAMAGGGPGDYTLDINNAGLTQLDMALVATGTPKPGVGYSIAVRIGGGIQTTYPAPMLIEATVRGDAPITGLKVVATVSDPAGKTTDVTLLDDGKNGDAIADDGTYTASYHYKANGTHSVTVVADNSDGNGQTTAEGVAVAVREDGTSIVPPPVPVTEAFFRSSAGANIVQAFQSDDHPSIPKVPVTCTSLGTNNTRLDGRIDSAGDVDCFFFKSDRTDADLVVRVTGLSGGMSPVITVYDPSGTKSLLVVNQAASENPPVGTVATIPSAALVTAGHVVTVKHADGSATTGNYRLSLGPRQVSDVRQVASTDDLITETTGGAVGPLGALVLGFLALLGLRQRHQR